MNSHFNNLINAATVLITQAELFSPKAPRQEFYSSAHESVVSNILMPNLIKDGVVWEIVFYK